MKYVSSLIFILLAGCAGKEYPKDRTFNDMIDEHDQRVINGGIIKSKHGRMYEVKVEELTGVKHRLETQVWERDQKIEYLSGRVKELEYEVMAMRVRLGLAPEKPKPQGKCCDERGFLIGHKDAPTLQEELEAAQTKTERKASVAAPAERAVSSEPIESPMDEAVEEIDKANE